jgi:hypothetical protein
MQTRELPVAMEIGWAVATIEEPLELACGRAGRRAAMARNHERSACVPDAARFVERTIA